MTIPITLKILLRIVFGCISCQYGHSADDPNGEKVWMNVDKLGIPLHTTIRTPASSIE